MRASAPTSRWPGASPLPPWTSSHVAVGWRTCGSGSATAATSRSRPILSWRSPRPGCTCCSVSLEKAQRYGAAAEAGDLDALRRTDALSFGSALASFRAASRGARSPPDARRRRARLQRRARGDDPLLLRRQPRRRHGQAVARATGQGCRGAPRVADRVPRPAGARPRQDPVPRVPLLRSGDRPATGQPHGRRRRRRRHCRPRKGSITRCLAALPSSRGRASSSTTVTSTGPRQRLRVPVASATCSAAPGGCRPTSTSAWATSAWTWATDRAREHVDAARAALAGYEDPGMLACWLEELERRLSCLTDLHVTPAEIRILPIPADASLDQGDRCAPVRVARDGQDTRLVGLREARRVDAIGGGCADAGSRASPGRPAARAGQPAGRRSDPLVT